MAKKPNPVGRPRVRPKGASGVRVPMSDAERKQVNAAAERAGLSAAAWMRRELLRAAATH